MKKSLYVAAAWFAGVEALMLISLSSAVAEEGKGMSLMEKQLRQELAKPTSFDFVEVPLGEVIRYLANKHEIDIQFDYKALNEAGITTDRPITKTLKGPTLRTALWLLLRDLDLTAVNHDGILLITTTDAGDEMFVTRVYDIHDFTPEGGYDRLVDDLTNHVAPKQWVKNGGAGSISHFSSNGIDALIVTTTGAVHEGLETLLADLRQLRTTPTKNK